MQKIHNMQTRKTKTYARVANRIGEMHSRCSLPSRHRHVGSFSYCLRELASLLAKLHAHIFRARVRRKKKKGAETHACNSGEFWWNCTHVVLSRAHCHCHTAAHPPRVHFTADSATNFTDAATNIAIGNSFWIPWVLPQFSPETNIPRVRTVAEARRRGAAEAPAGFTAHVFASEALRPVPPLSLSLSLSLSLYIYLFLSLVSLSTGSFSLRKPFQCETRRVNPLAVPLCSATVACQVPFSLFTAVRLVADFGPFWGNNAAQLTEKIPSDVGVIFQKITFYTLFRAIHTSRVI